MASSSNPRVWAQPGVVHGYAGAQGFLEEGERVLFERIANAVRGEPILDLGVGGGRTVSLLAPLPRTTSRSTTYRRW